MPWCPICKNEYYEGVKVCADCQVELVDSLEEERAKKKSSGFLSEDDKLRLAYVQKVFDEDVDMDSEHDVNDILQAFEDTLQADPSEYEGESRMLLPEKEDIKIMRSVQKTIRLLQLR